MQFHVLGTDNIKALFKDALKKHTPTKVTVLSSAIEAVIDQEVLAVTPGAQKVTLVMSQVRYYTRSCLLSPVLLFFQVGDLEFVSSRKPHPSL